MEINVIENKKSRLVFDVVGEDHTLCNALKHELWNDAEVKVAGYHIEHPLKGIPRMIVETTTKKEAKKAVMEAVKRLKKENEKAAAQVAKIK